MKKEDAFHALGDGHSIWKVDYAKKILKAVGLPWVESLARPFYSEPGVAKGCMMNKGQEGSLGVYSLTLSSHVYHTLGLTGAQDCIGRGSQARAYAEKVREHFKTKTTNKKEEQHEQTNEQGKETV